MADVKIWFSNFCSQNTLLKKAKDLVLWEGVISHGEDTENLFAVRRDLDNGETSTIFKIFDGRGSTVVSFANAQLPLTTTRCLETLMIVHKLHLNTIGTGD